jgi:hypothetical protein
VPYFLDGNNLIGLARRRSRPGADDRAALVSELCDRLRRTRARAVVFFDGPSGGTATALGSLSVRFSGGTSADDRILEEISRSRAPGEVTLVTADRELSRRARDSGAKVVSPEKFWAEFGATSGPAPERPEPIDVADWLKYFGDEGNRR